MKKHEKLELLNLPYSKLTQKGGPSLEGTPSELDRCLGVMRSYLTSHHYKKKHKPQVRCKMTVCKMTDYKMTIRKMTVCKIIQFARL